MTVFLLLIALSIGSPAAVDRLTIGVVGEIIFTSDMAPILEREGASFPFERLKPVLSGIDLTLGFLNSPVTTSGEASLEARIPFKAPTSAARGMALGGIKLLSLATPHIMDYGEQGLSDTIEFLNWYGVRWAGAGMNLEEARRPVELSLKGKRIAVLAYLRGDQFETSYAEADRPGPCPFSLPILEKEIPAAKERADLLIVMVHWGGGGKGLTRKKRFLARMCLELGADLFIGQESHRLYGIEIVDGKPIIYSLADLIFGLYDKRHSETVLPMISFKGKVESIELVPILVDDPKLKCQPRPLLGDEGREVLRKFACLCRELGTEVDPETGRVRLDR